MIDKEIFELADKLQDKLRQQKEIAAKAMEAIPEGELKEKLKSLMKKAASGKLKPEDANREISKILEYARNN